MMGWEDISKVLHQIIAADGGKRSLDIFLRPQELFDDVLLHIDGERPLRQGLNHIRRDRGYIIRGYVHA
jgi:hypothetical protein